MDIGIFIPIGSNGWLISTTSPQFKPSFELNRIVTQKAEEYGLDFALSMIKLRGFGGKSEFWDHCLESFTLMAGLAAVTKRIRLIATTAVLTLPPAIVARMISTIDSIAPGRTGVNIVSGWAEAEYSQMGLWPGKEHFAKRYQYSAEYITVMKDLWEKGSSDFKGEYFQMTDCKLSPQPSAPPTIVAAGQSEAGLAFGATYADYNFCLGEGVNTPTKCASAIARVVEAGQKTGRDVGAYILVMVIADETDEAAQAKWELYKSGKDLDALSWMGAQAAVDDKADLSGTAKVISNPVSAVNFNMGTLVGSYASVAAMLDEMEAIPGNKGVMLTFDDFIQGMDDFGTKIQPLMKSRAHVTAPVL
ncbi:pyrimidine utilization protein A [Roseomonas sp. GC11]|uniref:pyrimidine utilization protein A n=1 Tax=Roseomonas sp. GC11 TaxID=2950546 RepID=UPI00210B6190|nr:pyrimidine utilization protein A [Roseomonas sp. GC11]MCQ4159180.1 pyrimidine utilization protein A [Roseomonas sp. GC11]